MIAADAVTSHRRAGSEADGTDIGCGLSAGHSCKHDQCGARDSLGKRFQPLLEIVGKVDHTERLMDLRVFRFVRQEKFVFRQRLGIRFGFVGFAFLTAAHRVQFQFFLA